MRSHLQNKDYNNHNYNYNNNYDNNCNKDHIKVHRKSYGNQAESYEIQKNHVKT